jgi:O-antigen biosynthesis protein WbqP
MKRLLDLVLVSAAAPLLISVALLIASVIWLTDRGPPLFWSDRIGRNNRIFRMPKFRTMRVNTPQLPTHLMKNPDQWLTSIGPFLRRTSLDEIPQLWSILKGDMSIVGPRPALFNQEDLIRLRSERGIDKIKPGLTGWAQVNGRDTIPIPKKVELDAYYLEHQSLLLDLKIIWLTFLRVVRQRDIAH